MNTKNKIKKLLILAIVLMALPGLSGLLQAALVVEEPFDYTAGTDLTGSGGIGFEGAWYTTANTLSNPVFTVKDGSLSVATPGSGGIYVLDVAGNSAFRATDPGRAEANRAISAASQTALLANGSTIWFSVLYVNTTSNVSAFVIGTDTFDPTETWLLSSYPDTGEGFGFGTENADTIKAIAFDGTATPITVDSSVTAPTAKLIAGKIVWKANGTNDVMYLYNVTDLTTEPTTPIATVSADLDQSTFDLVALQHNVDRAVFDEIRIGATFADVTPYTFVVDTNPPMVTTLSPGDDSSPVMYDDFDLVMTFDEQIAVGTGNITIKNLTDVTQTVIDVTDTAQVSVAGAALTINPTVDLIGGKDYAIRIDATAIEDLAANTYVGIADDTTWNFTTISLDQLDLNLLVYEPFDYAIGTIPVGGIPVNPDTGLTGNWIIAYVDGTDPQISDTSVGYSTLPVAGNRWATGAVWTSPEIEANLDPNVIEGRLDDGDELWFSFTCYIPLLNQLTEYNQQQLRIGTDENNYVGIYPNKVNEQYAPGQLQAIISVDGIQMTGPTSVLYEENQHLYVGRAIFGQTDTIEAYLPEPDLALPAYPVSTVTGSVDQSAFAKVRSIIYNGNSMAADEIRIGTTYASVLGYPLSPDVDPGDNMVSWSGAEVQLDATVVNNDPGDPQMPLAYAWTHDAPDGYTVSFDPNPNVEDPAVTITKDAPTGDVTIITLQLTASNVGGTAPHFVPMKANMTIDLYDEACQAFRTAGTGINDSNLNTDCVTDFEDFAVMALTWLVDYELTEPVEKP
jgi:hypothetical protein